MSKSKPKPAAKPKAGKKIWANPIYRYHRFGFECAVGEGLTGPEHRLYNVYRACSGTTNNRPWACVCVEDGHGTRIEIEVTLRRTHVVTVTKDGRRTVTPLRSKP